MKLKNVKFLFVIVIVITSCSIDNRKQDKATLESKIKILSLQYNIIGLWSISEEINNRALSKCNVCPKVNFKSNNIASIIKSNGEQEVLKWEMIQDTLLLSNGERVVPFFKSKYYSVRFKKKIVLRSCI